ncbi:hypothetical protein RFI_38172 [Reticulomyxa filosa]|uniref:Uncharacterized protein n=1 Tax=Reticulomyxa filosa TaxID=46433 RepID=X6LF00_RETFI|nr:hypothetical protein RFI_38172 [Reticulomyxa filosa]|eukprot:ETN99309.1 hypothetical protein RFI_38172 [Reticulomyxa filosa]
MTKRGCLEITKEYKQMTRCPKNSNDPNFCGEMEQKDWKEYFEDLKRLIGGLSNEEYLKDESQANKIQNAKDLKHIWAECYAEDGNKWLLELRVICPDSSKKSIMEPGFEKGVIMQTREKKYRVNKQDKEDCKADDNIFDEEDDLQDAYEAVKAADIAKKTKKWSDCTKFTERLTKRFVGKAYIWNAYQSGDYKIIKSKLDELTALNEALKLSTIENEYNSYVTKLTNEWNKKN